MNAKTMQNNNHLKSLKPNPEAEWFGYQRIEPDQKTRNVINVFDSVAEKYDRMNDIMSFGLHRYWKDRFVRKIMPRRGMHVLDVAGGTGDIAFRLHKKTGKEGLVSICDINRNMLEVGRYRAFNKGIVPDRDNGLEFICANAENLPFCDNTVDVFTIAFGLRNVTHVDNALTEARRVLKPGGRFFCLEFSRMDHAILDRVYDFYSFKVIPQMGGIVAKDKPSYRYLVESIRRFPDQEHLADRIRTAGFENVKFENLIFGVAAIHQGLKL